MNRTSRTRAAVAAACLVAAAAAALAAPHNSKLLKRFEYTVGDAIAYRMEGIFRITAGLEAATLVYYDHESRNIVAEILGGTDDVEGAKREVEAYVEAIRQDVVPYARKRHQLELTDLDVTLIYYSDTGEAPPFEVVRRENGVYVVPVPENGGTEGREDRK